jgi:hypothetical protein
MRLIFLLFDFLTILSLVGGACYLIAKLNKNANREREWKKWLNTKTEAKDVTSEKMLADISQLKDILHNRVPKEVITSMSNIEEIIKTLSQPDSNFEEWKKTYTEESHDLIDILYKHIPESLHRYFSVPMTYTDKQKHRNGKNANDLLIETFQTFENRFNTITQSLVSENLNKLKTYQAFVHSKYDDKEIEY